VSDLSPLKYACQTYSWQMSMDRYRGQVEHMVAAAARAGFTGFEPEVGMLGKDWTITHLQDTLARHRIDLAALVLVQPWRHPVETSTERADADRVIQAVAATPGAIINLVPLPGPDRAALEERQHNMMSCVADIARRAAGQGVHCTFHPNSPAGSVFRTAADYRRLADLLPEDIGFTPDLGHLARGGMDPLSVVIQWGARVDHVHIKDLAADGRWATTGTGTINILGVLDHLAETNYCGWVTFEDESPQAEADPDTAVGHNGDFVRHLTSRVAS